LPILKIIINEAEIKPKPIKGIELKNNEDKVKKISVNPILGLKKYLHIKRKKIDLKNNLKKVNAYEEKIIVKKDVFVNKILSNVPRVLAFLTSLLKTFREEDIKSTDIILKKTFK
tara:strand:- start:215 stop:559 length:345 start_codon:yes stop_codon:yes gene_type:complete